MGDRAVAGRAAAGPAAEAPRPGLPRGHLGERAADAADRRADGRPGLAGGGRSVGRGRGRGGRAACRRPRRAARSSSRRAQHQARCGACGAGGGDYEGDYGETNQAVLLVHAEVQLARAAYPDRPLYVVKVDLRDYYPSIPHDVVLGILRRLGVPEAHLAVFARFLAPPLRSGGRGADADAARGADGPRAVRDAGGAAHAAAGAARPAAGPGADRPDRGRPLRPDPGPRGGGRGLGGRRVVLLGLRARDQPGEVGVAGPRGRAARPAAGRPPPVGDAGAGRARPLARPPGDLRGPPGAGPRPGGGRPVGPVQGAGLQREPQVPAERGGAGRPPRRFASRIGGAGGRAVSSRVLRPGARDHGGAAGRDREEISGRPRGRRGDRRGLALLADHRRRARAEEPAGRRRPVRGGRSRPAARTRPRGATGRLGPPRQRLGRVLCPVPRAGSSRWSPRRPR